MYGDPVPWPDGSEHIRVPRYSDLIILPEMWYTSRFTQSYVSADNDCASFHGYAQDYKTRDVSTHILRLGANMFDLRSYIILLNEAFDTGHDNDALYRLFEAFLVAENEPVRQLNTNSSELHQILNNNRVMHAFTRVMGGSVRLSTCFRQQVTALGRVDFVLLHTPRGLGIRFDGVVVCAVSPEGERSSVPPGPQLKH